MRIALIGGTGRLGPGLAKRWADAGHDVVIGSRDAERASEAAAKIGASVTGATNADAADSCEVAVITIPYAGVADTIPPLASQLATKVVVSTVVPLGKKDGVLQALLPAAGSAAEEIAAALPQSRICAALHSVSSAELEKDADVNGDSIVCGDDEDAIAFASGLVSDIRTLRPVLGGSLVFASACESLTSLLLSINKRYHAHSGIRIVGLEHAAEG